MIRALEYDNSVKVAIRFSGRTRCCGTGWEASYTDRLTTVVAYPSYGIGGPTGASVVVSYTWLQNALRFGALAGGKEKGGEGVEEYYEGFCGYPWCVGGAVGDEGGS